MQTDNPDAARAYAEILRDDRHAPRYHFISPQRNNDCFDPNGAIFWKGRYHLFFIHQEERRRTGPEFWRHGHCWGHASSADLIHWTLHPTALAADPGDPELAIFSGCAFINKDGVPTIVYHGYGAGTCIATALDDGLIAWRKSKRNPVIPEPKKEGDSGWNVYNVFDPFVWREDETYYAILGGKMKPGDVGDSASLFRSSDLTHWEYLHPFYEPNPAWTGPGDDCACPKFFRLGDRYMLLCISHALGTRYYLGDYRDQKFVPHEHHAMNWPGGPCFAPETLLDETGRCLFWAWVIDQRAEWWKTGAPGVMTLPRVLSMNADGGGVEPAVELESLRKNHRRLDNFVIHSGEAIPLQNITGDCLELGVELAISPDTHFELALRVSPDSAEKTIVAFDASTGELSIDTTRSTLAGDGWRPAPMDFWRGIPTENVMVQKAPLALKPGESLRLRVFLDRSILEVFANGRLCMAQRIYPSRPDSVGVTLAAKHGEVIVHRLDAWDMGSLMIT
jgi:beta-fructofuranosidase